MRLAVLALACTGCSSLLGIGAFRPSEDTPVDAVAGHTSDGSSLDVHLPIDAPTIESSCLATLQVTPGAPSGPYLVDPDGPGGDPPITVNCDMTSDGGGWTIVYFASSADVAGPPVTYSVTVPGLLGTAQDALIAFRRSDLTALPGAARFAMPSEWRTDTPFNYGATDLSVAASIDGAPAVSATLRYGSQNFGQVCGDAWAPAIPAYGRLCVAGTSGPFYSGFIGTGTDYCSDSTGNYAVSACAVDRRFSIAVR